MVLCALCNGFVHQRTGAINRARKIGAPIYCGRKCAGLARRTDTTPEERKEAKRKYDAERRAGPERERLLAEKRAYHHQNYDPDKAAVVRKRRMPYHLEYCRRPEYRAQKRTYDIERRARINFGEFAEVALMLRDVEAEVTSRATRTQIAIANGTLNKTQTRKRAVQ